MSDRQQTSPLIWLFLLLLVSQCSYEDGVKHAKHVERKK